MATTMVMMILFFLLTSMLASKSTSVATSDGTGTVLLISSFEVFELLKSCISRELNKLLLY